MGKYTKSGWGLDMYRVDEEKEGEGERRDVKKKEGATKRKDARLLYFPQLQRHSTLDPPRLSAPPTTWLGPKDRGALQ